MSHQNNHRIDRREFMGTIAAGALLAAAQGAGAQEARPARALKVGLVGCGGRGSWIANLFKEHGGYQFVATGDYFDEPAQRAGAALGVEKNRCFSGLSAYKRVIESGVEAVILETPPYFFPEHASAAVEAGLHVYMAKPVAVDVPGTLRVGAAGEAATRKKRVFYVDYQMPTDPFNIEVAQRLKKGALGDLQMVFSSGNVGGNGFEDPPLGATIENRLQKLIWVNDDVMGCGYIGNYDIHSIDAVIWAMGRRPVSAYGTGLRCRKDPHGDAQDTLHVTYAFADGLIWQHQSVVGATHDWMKQGSLEASIQGTAGAARIAYWGKAYVRGGPGHYGGGAVEDLYAAGARRNIAAFHARVLAGDCGNETAQRSVDCTLTCILGREAARRKTFLTMDQILKENKALEVNLKGLRA